MRDFTTPSTYGTVPRLVVIIAVVTSVWISRPSTVLGSTQPDWRQSLFPATDPISQLWANNFTSTIQRSNQAWIVMFYAAWCGHCRSVAPIYSNFSRGIQGWSPVVRVASVSCSDSYNSEICQTYGVNGYPTFKLFPPHADSSQIGIHASQLQPRDVTHNLRNIVLTYLDQLIQNGTTDQSWPHLASFRRMTDLWSNEAEYTFAVVENSVMSENHVGLAVLLDMLASRPRILIGRTDVQHARVHDPGLYTYSRSRSLSLLSRETGERGIIEAIKGHTGTDTIASSASQDYTTTIAPITPAPQDPLTYRPKGLHLTDLESGLYRSLYLEISMKPVSGEKLVALKKYIHLLNLYLPGENHVKMYLARLDNWIQATTHPISTDIWLQKLREIQSSDAFIRQNETYIGCAGSSNRYRGYTCSLWMTFHAVTVKAYQTKKDDQNFRPLKVLKVIADYVKHFFGCRECARHFGLMARTMRHEVRSSRDVVLWLWKSHNSVNERLHGESTEDPIAPKVQFPPQTTCPQCFRSAQSDPFEVPEEAWSLDDVLAFLLSYYSAENSIASSAPACDIVRTDWTPCSRTCGEGVSTRTTTDETDCSIVQQVRLCMIRPCSARFRDWTRSPWHIDNCPRFAHTYRLSRPRPLSYGNCTTVNSKAWFICGVCPNTRSGQPICCRPARSSTRLMDLTCRDGSGGVQHQGTTSTKMLVEHVEFCECTEDCSREHIPRH